MKKSCQYPDLEFVIRRQKEGQLSSHLSSFLTSQFISHCQFSGVQFSSHNVQFLLLISVLTSLFSSVQFSLLVLSSVQFTSSCQFSAVYSSVLTQLSSYFYVQFIGVYNSLLIRSHHSQFSYSVISPQH